MTQLQKHQLKANELLVQYPDLVQDVKTSPWGGKVFIEVSTVDKAKALNQLYPEYNFSSGCYK